MKRLIILTAIVGGITVFTGCDSKPAAQKDVRSTSQNSLSLKGPGYLEDLQNCKYRKVLPK